MSTYTYTAKDKNGNIFERTREAASRADVYSFIREEGATPIAIKESKEHQRANVFGGFLNGIKTEQKIIFAKNLGGMLNAGLSVTRSLAVLGKQTKSKALKSILQNLESDVSKGEPLSAALAKRPYVFSSLFVSMVKAGEESGNLSGSLKNIASQMEKSHQLAKKVRGALIYPGVIISLMVVIGILMLIFMVPTLTETFAGLNIELPLSTRVIIGASRYLVENTFLVIAALILLIAIVVSLFKSKGGKRFADRLFIKIPLVGPLVKEVQSARTARTLSSLLGAGVSIIQAIEVTRDVLQNHLYKDALTAAKNAVEKGEPMSAVFIANERFYPVFVGEMVAVGEETGKIAEMLEGVATYYEDEVDQKTKDLSTIIEPVLMIIIGLAVGIFAISMLAPTYSLVGNI